MSTYSVGYNGVNPQRFLDILKPYGEKIESIFFSAPCVYEAHAKVEFGKYGSTYEENIISLLSLDIPYKKYITLNTFPLKQIMPNRDKIELTLFPFIEKYRIDGVIITDLYLGELLRNKFKWLDIDTSCNCFQFTLREMNVWNKKLRIHYFNPPREILRMPKLLKEMHDAGFKLKCIVNEACNFGCPTQMKHQGYVSQYSLGYFKNETDRFECLHGDAANFFRANWILPRWENELEKYVDCFKLSTRKSTEEELIKILDAYINRRDDVNLIDIASGGMRGKIRKICEKNKVTISVSDIPDKLKECECKQCDISCFICHNLAEKYKLYK